MQIDDADKRFLQQRQVLLRSWGSIGPVLVAAVLIFYGTVWFAAPMLVSPLQVMNRLQAGGVDLTTLQTMAIMLPLVTSLLCLVLVGMIAFVYRSVRIERQYHTLLARLESESPSRRV